MAPSYSGRNPAHFVLKDCNFIDPPPLDTPLTVAFMTLHLRQAVACQQVTPWVSQLFRPRPQLSEDTVLQQARFIRSKLLLQILQQTDYVLKIQINYYNLY